MSSVVACSASPSARDNREVPEAACGSEVTPGPDSRKRSGFQEMWKKPLCSRANFHLQSDSEKNRRSKMLDCPGTIRRFNDLPVCGWRTPRASRKNTPRPGTPNPNKDTPI